MAFSGFPRLDRKRKGTTLSFDIVDFHSIPACLPTDIPERGNTHMSEQALKLIERSGVSSAASELGL